MQDKQTQPLNIETNARRDECKLRRCLNTVWSPYFFCCCFVLLVHLFVSNVQIEYTRSDSCVLPSILSSPCSVQFCLVRFSLYLPVNVSVYRVSYHEWRIHCSFCMFSFCCCPERHQSHRYRGVFLINICFDRTKSSSDTTNHTVFSLILYLFGFREKTRQQAKQKYCVVWTIQCAVCLLWCVDSGNSDWMVNNVDIFWF